MGSVKSKDKHGRNPLMFAALRRRPKSMHWLLENVTQDFGAVNKLDELKTALMYACLPYEGLRGDDFDNSSCVQLLLPYTTTDILNKRSTSGNTALHYACAYGYVKTAARLLQRRDIDLGILNAMGMTAEQVAQTHGYHGIVQRMTKHSYNELVRRCTVDMDTSCTRIVFPKGLLAPLQDVLTSFVGEFWIRDVAAAVEALPHDDPLRTFVSAIPVEDITGALLTMVAVLEARGVVTRARDSSAYVVLQPVKQVLLRSTYGGTAINSDDADGFMSMSSLSASPPPPPPSPLFLTESEVVAAVTGPLAGIVSGSTDMTDRRLLDYHASKPLPSRASRMQELQCIGQWLCRQVTRLIDLQGADRAACAAARDAALSRLSACTEELHQTRGMLAAAEGNVLTVSAALELCRGEVSELTGLVASLRERESKLANELVSASGEIQALTASRDQRVLSLSASAEELRERVANMRQLVDEAKAAKLVAEAQLANTARLFAAESQHGNGRHEDVAEDSARMRHKLLVANEERVYGDVALARMTRELCQRDSTIALLRQQVHSLASRSSSGVEAALAAALARVDGNIDDEYAVSHTLRSYAGILREEAGGFGGRGAGGAACVTVDEDTWVWVKGLDYHIVGEGAGGAPTTTATGTLALRIRPSESIVSRASWLAEPSVRGPPEMRLEVWLSQLSVDVLRHLPAHVGIVRPVHCYRGSTGRVVTSSAAQAVPDTALFVAMPAYDCSLDQYVHRRGGASKISEREWQLLLLQLLEVVLVLQEHWIVHGKLEAGNILLSGTDAALSGDPDAATPRVHLAGLEDARLVRQAPSEEDQMEGHMGLLEWGRLLYTDRAMLAKSVVSRATCDPHVVSVYTTGPRIRTPLYLEDIYQKSDVFALGQMMARLFGVSSEDGGAAATAAAWYRHSVSAAFDAFLATLVCDTKEDRPTVRQAYMRLGALCFQSDTSPSLTRARHSALLAPLHMDRQDAVAREQRLLYLADC